MNNLITIEPANSEIELKANALKKVSWFISKGFGHQGFLSVVAFHFNQYSDERGKRRLSNWWYTKIADEQINDDVQTVINHLKNE